jgi:hypothetical protein
VTREPEDAEAVETAEDAEAVEPQEDEGPVAETSNEENRG